ncbi:MAG: adenylyltransferase/cytidyltransferase family protein [Thermoguttaceae bacterium]
MGSRSKVLVSGCYDLLHAGHITFFETAARYGDLYVCVGSDENIRFLKGHPTRFSQEERVYMVGACRYVTHARVSSGSGMLDFEPDMAEIRPDYFVVNEDGMTEGKRALCDKFGAELVVLPRTPKPGLPPRSSTAVKAALAEAIPPDESRLPYRVCLAGGWMDQPFMSRHHPGSVVVVNIQPTRPFNLRSGMATSTRNLWQRIEPYRVYPHDPVELARLLFGYENPPGTKYVSGSQDHLGLTMPGANRLYYDGGYWPDRIDSTVDDEICRWLERSLVLVELFARPPGYDPLTRQNITPEGVARLGAAGDLCWDAILQKDIRKLGRSLTDTHNAWAELLPLTTSDEIQAELDSYRCHGRITSGCGGGYIVMATDEDVPGGFRIRVRR